MCLNERAREAVERYGVLVYEEQDGFRVNRHGDDNIFISWDMSDRCVDVG